MPDIPLHEQLLNPSCGPKEALSGIQPTCIIQTISKTWNQDLQHEVGANKSVQLDRAQAQSLVVGLSRRVNLIHGPPGMWLLYYYLITMDVTCCIAPKYAYKLGRSQCYKQWTPILNIPHLGTGKSCIGSLIAKILHDETQETLLVITYTNHALDQFLLDIENIGVPKPLIVRLGPPGMLWPERLRHSWVYTNCNRDPGKRLQHRRWATFSTTCDL